MKNRQTFTAFLLTAFVVGSVYFGISLGSSARQVSQSNPNFGQVRAKESKRLAQPVAVALSETVSAKDDPFPFRLRNTKAPIGELVRSETAVLLRNAFIDTKLAQDLPIPDAFKAVNDPLTYIAQSRGPATSAFRRHIALNGGKIVSYIPNNAYLVRMNTAGAARLADWHGTQSVLPFEPYYKLEMKLLEMALTDQSLPEGALLNVVLFPESEPLAAKRLAALGIEVLSEDRTPFGAKLVARIPSDMLAALARLTEVQGLERYRPRRLANDLTRPRLGVEIFEAETDDDGAVTGVSKTDYLGLTGNRIYVNINDTGVDDHDAFGRRLFGPSAGQDRHGHGTFVAGIIAGDGSGSGTIKTNPPPGSYEDPDFKGMAPKAKLHVLRADDYKVNNHISDNWLQTESATYHYFKSPKQEYALISNNSWEYDEENDYTWAAASYDAATRDALPDKPGDQQVIYVFPAGNSGEGSNNGLNASPNSISAPGTAKNVITVGAIEALRDIAIESKSYETNTVTEADEDGNEIEKEEITTTTNTPFSSQTDSDNQVAFFSSRGNVGIGIEGQYGRFKPDLVAPGTFIISTKTRDWDDSITITTNTLNEDEAFVYGGWLHRSEEDAEARRELDEQLGNQYRYGSGTSMAAPAISGLLALMQEFFIIEGDQTNTSPALLKALLINSAQSVDARYDHNVQGTVNHQGWGLPNLQRAVPAKPVASVNTDNSTTLFIEQSLTNALATGESRSWEITLSSNAMHYPMRFTLAWTDPPGNPNAAVKLVNDLDLIVTPMSDSSEDPNGPGDPVDPSDPEDEVDKKQEVYYGNNIGASIYSSMGATNDVINNVENVFIEEPTSQNYRVTVYARRVNVDSLSAFYNAEEPADHIDVVQDFALVMSSANPELEGAFDDVKPDKPEVIELPAVASLTNGMPMLHQRVGANSALAKETDPAHTVYANRRGITNQWHFYTFVNAPKKKEDPDDTDDSNPPDDPSESAEESQPSFGKHVAFITFMPPNLSSPRHREADIDLYVSRDSNLTNLEPAVLDAAFRSIERGGTEFITFDDAKVDESEVFYIGVKSEDQMAAEYGLVGLSTDNANGFSDDDGNIYMLPLPAVIPDGSAANPGGVSIFGVYTGMPYDYVRKVTATSIIHHEEVGDLWGQLSHNRNAVVLNNHTLTEPVTGKPYPTDFVFVYDDELDSSRIMPGSIPTDGPGSLNDFQWKPAMGVWQLDMVDSALTFTGLVEHLNLKVDAIKNLSMIGNRGIDVHLDPGENEDFLVEVPFNATNMIVQLTEMTGPVDVYIRKDTESNIDADPQVYDKSTVDAGVKPGPDGKIGTGDDIVEWDGNPSRGELQYGLNDLPPLSEGRWFVTIDNPELTEVDFHLKVIFEYDISLDNTIKLVSDEPEPIDDDIVTKSVLTVTNDFLVGMAEVGVRIDHPRIADLDLHLVSPQGTRLLLSENRGHTNIAYGMMLTDENETLPIIEDGFESAENDFIDDSSKFHSGWELDSGEVYVYRAPQSGLSAHSGEQFVEMNGIEPGSISTNCTTEVGRNYRLRFAYAKNPEAEKQLQMKVFIGTVTNLTVTASIEGSNNTLSWKIQEVVFTAESGKTRIRFNSLEEEDYAVMLDSVRLDEVTPENVYAVFSELENLSKSSMKFGDAPYAKKEEQVFFSGFEDISTGYAQVDDILDGWTVTNKSVFISRDKAAHTGNSFAILSGDQSEEEEYSTEELWKFETGGWVSSSPAIAEDGTVYIGSDDGSLYAINLDGTKKWEFKSKVLTALSSSPTIGSDGTIYVGSGDDNLYAINHDGTTKWAYKTGANVDSSPTIGTEGTIYVGSNDGRLYAVNPDGSKKWEFKTGDYVSSSPVVLFENRAGDLVDVAIYVGSEDDNLYAINSDGSLKWVFKTDGNVESSPVIGGDGTIYVGSNDGNLYAINPDGSRKWAYKTGKYIHSSPAIAEDGTVYVGSSDKNLYAVNSDGSLKWIFKTQGNVESSPAIGGDGTIYVGSDDGNLYAINPDGSRRWEFRTAWSVRSSPAIGIDDVIYVGSWDKNCYAIQGSKNSEMGGAIVYEMPTAFGQDYRLSFATHAEGTDSEFVIEGVATNLVDGSITLTNAIPKSDDWIINTIRFTAARSSVPLTIRTKNAAVRLDTVELIGPGPHNLAEEPLDVLNGERAMGDWVLEVRDHRVGLEGDVTDIESLLLSWYIKIIGSEVEDTELTDSEGETYTRDDTAEALRDGRKKIGRIYENETHYWTVRTCSDSTRLNIALFTGKKKRNAKVSLLASYGGFPVYNSAVDDFVIVDMDDPDTDQDDPFKAWLSISKGSGHLPLQPGELLFLTVNKTDQYDTNRALYEIRATWDGNCRSGDPPSTDGAIRMVSAIGSESGLAKPDIPIRFLWEIPSNTRAALIEATGFTADTDIELISADGRYFRNSIHSGQAPEQIVLREGAMIETLTGDWIVQVNATGDLPSLFTLHTTLSDERGHLISSLPIELEIEGQYSSPKVRLSWPSLPGEHYHLESSVDLINWFTVHELTAGSAEVVFDVDRSWFGERYYRVKQLNGDH